MATVTTNWTSPLSATLDKSTGGGIDETMTDAWSSNQLNQGGTVGYIGCRAHNSGAQSLGDSAVVALALAAESADSDPNGAMHDTATDNSRVTIRTAGMYHLSCWVQWDTNGTGLRTVGLRHNGVTTLAQDRRAAVSGTLTEITVVTAYVMAANDYVEIVGQQTSGGALNVNTAVLAVVKA